MGCKIYPKIDTLYTRDEKFKVTDEIRRPEFLVPREWLVTEQIHGTNIRVSLEPATTEPPPLPAEYEWVMQINGRNDNSQIPPNLLRHLQETFTPEGLKSLWLCKGSCTLCGGTGRLPILGLAPVKVEGEGACPNLDPYPITLYGEGYGGGIQKGGSEYTSKTKGGAVSFRLFDVLVGETWLRRADVEDVAEKLGIETVPLLGDDFDLDEIASLVRGPFLESTVAHEEGTSGHMAEGVVAFTAEPLYNNRGQRLMFKLKVSDFE